MGQLQIILDMVHDAGIKEDYFDSSDFTEIDEDVNLLKSFAAEELKVLVDSLLSSLPSLLHEARSKQMRPLPRLRIAVSQSLEVEKSHPASAKELLEIAVQLTEGISEAFDEFFENEQPSAKISVGESLRDLYNKEVDTLKKWKEENGPRMSGKLNPQNKAVWEALEATVFNMTDLLSEFSPLDKEQSLLISSRQYVKSC
jgi:hypothetical protein